MRTNPEVVAAVVVWLKPRARFSPNPQSRRTRGPAFWALHATAALGRVVTPAEAAEAIRQIPGARLSDDGKMSNILAAKTLAGVVVKNQGLSGADDRGPGHELLMNREAKTRSRWNKTRSDVAKEIAAEHGYEGEVLDAINQTAETGRAGDGPPSSRDRPDVSAAPIHHSADSLPGLLPAGPPQNPVYPSLDPASRPILESRDIRSLAKLGVG